jgi:hypothetical protein
MPRKKNPEAPRPKVSPKEQAILTDIYRTLRKMYKKTGKGPRKRR